MEQLPPPGQRQEDLNRAELARQAAEKQREFEEEQRQAREKQAELVRQRNRGFGTANNWPHGRHQP